MLHLQLQLHLLHLRVLPLPLRMPLRMPLLLLLLLLLPDLLLLWLRLRLRLEPGGGRGRRGLRRQCPRHLWPHGAGRLRRRTQPLRLPRVAVGLAVGLKDKVVDGGAAAVAPGAGGRRVRVGVLLPEMRHLLPEVRRATHLLA